MAMMVKTRLAEIVEARWGDYQYALTPELGASRRAPAPDDRREEVAAALGVGGTKGLTAARNILDEIWAADQGRWQRRLSSFLKRLGAAQSRTFGELVAAGCQPDRLAERFTVVSQPNAVTRDQQRILEDIDALARLLAGAVSSLGDLVRRKEQFDQRLSRGHYRVFAGDEARTELHDLQDDLQDIAANEEADLRRLRRRLDGRRHQLLGDATVKLLRHLKVVTGSYHDRDVAAILNDLGADSDQTTAEALKKKRKRWTERLRGGRKQGAAETD